MNKSRELNLTKGNPTSVIIQFAIPLLLTSLLQNLYTTIDTIVVGQFCGKVALAGVGSTGAINFLIIGFCIGLCSGFVIPVAQYYGADDYRNLRKTVANCLWIGGSFALLITVIVCFFCKDILLLMQTPDDCIGYAYKYIFIIFAGIPITISYNMLAGILRSLGDSRSPMYFLMMASVINIGFDIVSVTVLGLGVMGPAIATLLSQLFSAILCLKELMTKFDFLKMKPGDWKFEASLAGKLCGMGIPMGLQYSITAVGSVLLQSGINSLGSDAIAAIAAAGRCNLFLMSPFDALGSSLATYAGQNIGARKPDRIGQGVKSANLIGFAYYLFINVVVFFSAPSMVLLFIKAQETTAIAMAIRFLRTNVSLFLFLILVNNLRYTIQGLGYSAFAICAGVFEMFARSIVGIVLIPYFGFASACFANPSAWMAADLFLVPAYFISLGWARKRLSTGEAVLDE